MGTSFIPSFFFLKGPGRPSRPERTVERSKMLLAISWGGLAYIDFDDESRFWALLPFHRSHVTAKAGVHDAIGDHMRCARMGPEFRNPR